MIYQPTLGTITLTDPAKVLAKAAEKLGVPVPPTDEARVERVARAILREQHGKYGAEGDELDRAVEEYWRQYIGQACAAIAAMD